MSAPPVAKKSVRSSQGHGASGHESGMGHGGMGGGGMAQPLRRRQGRVVYNEESADPVYPPVPVEVQGIIYIYNPPKIQNPGETAGENGGQAAPATSPARRRPPPAPPQVPVPHAGPLPPLPEPHKPATVTPGKEVVHEVQNKI